MINDQQNELATIKAELNEYSRALTITRQQLANTKDVTRAALLEKELEWLIKHEEVLKDRMFELEVLSGVEL